MPPLTPDPTRELERVGEPQHVLCEGSNEKSEYSTFKNAQARAGTIITSAEAACMEAIRVPQGASATLICEECERAYARVACEACRQVLCARCATLVHLQGTAGADRTHVRSAQLRRLLPRDTSCVAAFAERRSVTRDDYVPEVTEEDLLRAGVDLSQPTPLEAPTLAAVARSSSVAAAPNFQLKFKPGDLVLFRVDAADTCPDFSATPSYNDHDFCGGDGGYRISGRNASGGGGGSGSSSSGGGSGSGGSSGGSGSGGAAETRSRASLPLAPAPPPGRSDQRASAAGTAAACNAGAATTYASLAVRAELYGMVLAQPLRWHGQWGLPERRGGADGGQFHRVQVVGAATPGLRELERVQQRLRQLRQLQQAGDVAVPQRRGTTESVIVLGARGAAKLVKERRAAAARDARVRAARALFAPPPPEPLLLGLPQQTSGEGGDGLVVQVVVVAEHELLAPLAERDRRDAQRIHALKRLLLRVSEQERAAGLARGAAMWRAVVVAIIAQERRQASIRMQAVWRGYLARRRALALRWMKLQAEEEAAPPPKGPQFHFATRGQGGITTNGRTFFSTHKELRAYEDAIAHAFVRLFKLLASSIRLRLRRSFSHWHGLALSGAPVGQFRGFDPTTDPSLADAPASDGPGQRALLAPQLLPHQGLPPLPPLLPSLRNPNMEGGLLELGPAHGAPDYSRLVRLTRGLRGPCEAAAWAVPGLVLMGGYPDGAARAFPSHFVRPRTDDAADAIGVLDTAATAVLLSGVGLLLSVATEAECAALERARGLQPMQRVFQDALQMVTAHVMGKLSEEMHLLRTVQQERQSMAVLNQVSGGSSSRRSDGELDAIAREKAAREVVRCCQAALERLPKKVRVVYAVGAHGTAEAPTSSGLISACAAVEGALREGERVYVWSIGGRGRAAAVCGALLGRIYQCSAAEALARVQLCSAARQLQAGALMRSVPLISCPQTAAQRLAVQEALRLGSDPGWCALQQRSEAALASHALREQQRHLAQLSQRSPW